MTRKRWALALVPPVLAAPVAFAAFASAGVTGPQQATTATAEKTYSISLGSVNKSGATGRAMLTLRGDRLTVRLTAKGLGPGMPHVAHVHGTPKGGHSFVCPTAKTDKNKDGIVTTGEAVEHTGGVGISLTTRGETGPESGLAVDRYPVADAKGNLSYERTFTVPANFAKDLTQFAVVQHGVDFNKNGKYDFEAGKSELDENLPQEATAPATCGVIETASVSKVPVGGVETGGDFATETGANPALIGLGAASLAGAAMMSFLIVSRGRREVGSQQ